MRFPNGYGSISKLSGNRRKPFMVQIHCDKDEFGVRTRKPLSYHATRKEAFAALTEYNKNPYDLMKKKLTFAEIYNLWYEPHCIGRSESLKYVYHAAFNEFTAIHDVVFEDLRAYHFEPILQALKSSKAKKDHMTAMLSQLYKYALKHDIVDRNYSGDLIIGEVNEPSVRAPFSDIEIKKLSKLTGLIPDTILIMCYSGFRIGELLEMRTANIDLDEMLFRGGLKTASGKNRVVPIHKSIQPIVMQYYNADNEYLIAVGYEDRLDYTNYSVAFRGFMASLNMDHIPHEARHTFITNLDRADAKDNIIKLLVGHAQKDFTKKVYTHNTLKQMRDAIELLSGF